MTSLLRDVVAGAVVGCLVAVSAYAQELPSASAAPAPANLAFVEGAVDVIQDGLSERADPPVMLIDGDVVRARGGRAEIVFGDGTLLHLSHDSELEILGEERLRLLTGRAIMRVARAAARPYLIDTPGASVQLEAEGEYEINTASSARLEVSVARGVASIDAGQRWTIRGGQMLTVAGPGGRPLIAPFNSAQWDAFETWSYDRANGFINSVSAEQLPYELRPYAPVLDHYGRWDYVAPHGYVWFPSVGASWRPYYDGSWSFTRYGWTWHGRDRWAWPTHHYGRWGFNGAFWYWIPATGWAPAWVTWSVAPGYVSWAPLGWHTPGRYDAWDRRDHPAYAPRYNPWRGWTVLPRHEFGPRRNVRAHVVEGDRLDEPTRRVLLTQATPSRPQDDVAVPRNSVVTPGARGSVRRPPPAPAPTPSGAVPATRDRRDDPAYTPPSSWSGVATRVDDRGDRGTAERRSAPRGGDDNAGAAQRRGADRDPNVRSAPRNEPRGGTASPGPAARQPESSKGSAAGAVSRRPGA
jgi:hypothetical protein